MTGVSFGSLSGNRAEPLRIQEVVLGYVLSRCRAVAISQAGQKDVCPYGCHRSQSREVIIGKRLAA